MLRRLVLGLSLLVTAACSHDRASPCVEDKAYCEGNVANYCKATVESQPREWESRACEAGQTCIKGACLNEPLVACSTPHASACSDDRQRMGICDPVGYWNWHHTCETAIGEACYSIGMAGVANCIFPSLGGCSPEGTHMCHQNRVLACFLGFWQQAGFGCDASLGEACVVGRTTPHGMDVTTCILPDLGVCSPTDPPVCQGNHIVECQPVGYWAKSEDCAPTGQICLNGQCVDSTVLPGRP